MVAVIVPWVEGTLLYGLNRDMQPDGMAFGLTAALYCTNKR